MEVEETEPDFAEDSSSVRVALRIRPCLPREQIEGCKTCTTVAEDQPQVWIGSNHAFTYDYVFDTDSAQSSIFEMVVKRLIDGCLHGYNATILAYGQTGSGKTYTMGTGFDYDPSAEAQGIIPRAVTYMFNQIDKIRTEKADQKADFKVELNFVELYNEEVVDLLSQTSIRPSSGGGVLSRPGSAASIRIHEDSSGSIYLVGVQTVPVASCHETLKILREGALSRTTASTNMNDTSSRSHAIFTMHVTQTRVSNEFGEAELETLSAKFHFVDLAGSERLKRTLATGDRAKEGISINCGLLALGNVISALGDKMKKSSHVPYRDSKLTRLLQDSLGGNSRTVMIACVSPSDRDFVETLNTLKYANRARNIKNRIQINQDKSSRTIASLRREIELLQSELLEYKQGKRNDASEYSDTHQENILLITEIESLKSRLKSKQDSIDKLNSVVAAQRTDTELKILSGSGSGGTDCDLTKMIQTYLMEIEDLRTKLYESEQECEKLRIKQRRLNTSLSSPRKQLIESTMSAEVLLDAKADVQNDRKKLEYLASTEKTNDEDESDSDSESDHQEKLEEIAQLTSEINIKEMLIQQLEQSHRRVESMKVHYEEKLECLQNKIKATQDERDKVMASLKNGKRSAQVDADYEKKISAMQAEVKKWQQMQKQHTQTIKDQSKYEKQIDRLKIEVDSLKQIKVKLLKQSKVDSAKFREMELRRQKEIATLKKDQRIKEIKLKSLENDKIMRDQVLKRKLEEVSNLKKQNKLQMSRKAHGKAKVAGSPIKAKSRWTNLQHEIRKSVSLKTTVSSLEKEMLNLIEERAEAQQKLLELQRLERDELVDEDIENVRINLSFLEERISEIQNQIAEISSGVKDYDGTEFGDDEIQYLFKKVFEMNIGNLIELDRSERQVDDLEETNKQQLKEISSLRDMLHHMINRQKQIANPNNEEDYLPELPPPQTASFDSTFNIESNAKMRKARRLTSTTQELLGSLENVSKSEFLNPNDVLMGNFVRNTRQTQSLRVNTNARRRPQLNRQDTYNVGDRRFNLDPPEKLRPEGCNGNMTETLNTTFILESSPPAISSSYRLTNSPSDSNNICDIINTNNTNHEGKGIIRRVSSGNKDKVLQLTYVTEGHSKPVISMYATDSKLFTGSKDSTAKEFDLNTGVEVKTFKGHPTNVQCVKYEEDTDVLITASGSFVKLWDARTAACIKTLTSSGTVMEKAQSNFDTRLLQPGENQIQSIALLRNYLYTTFDNRIRVWDLRKLQSSIGILAGKHASSIMCLATATDIKLDNDIYDVIVSGSKDHYIKLYTVKPGQAIDTIVPKKNLNPPHYDGIESLLIKNSNLYSGSRDMCIKKWDIKKAEMICSAANAHGGWVTGLSKLPASSNLDYIMSSSRDGSVKVWDKDLKEVIRVDVGGSSSNFSVESLCVNTRYVFTAGGSLSNSNNGTTTNGAAREYGVGIWEFKESILVNSQTNYNNNEQLTS